MKSSRQLLARKKAPVKVEGLYWNLCKNNINRLILPLSLKPLSAQQYETPGA